MTAFTLPPLAVDYDARWVAVDLGGDLGDWARRTAIEVLSGAGGQSGRWDQRRVTGLLEGAGALARQGRDASIALLLYPNLGEGVKAVVRFCPVDLAGQEAEDAWAQLLDTLAPALPGQEPPEVTEIASRAGPCRRIRQRHATGEGSERSVGERLGYLWALPEYGAGVVMTTAFTDLLEAGRWRPALDELAAAVELEQPAGEVAPD